MGGLEEVSHSGWAIVGREEEDGESEAGEGESGDEDCSARRSAMVSEGMQAQRDEEERESGRRDKLTIIPTASQQRHRHLTRRITLSARRDKLRIMFRRAIDSRFQLTKCIVGDLKLLVWDSEDEGLC